MRGADEVLIGKFERACREWAPDKRFDLFLGNPPYSYAAKHSELALNRLVDDGFLWFLLRQAVNNTAGRAEFWEKYPSKYQTTLVERVSFTGGGTDQTEYTYFEWQKGFVWSDGWERFRRKSWKSK